MHTASIFPHHQCPTSPILWEEWVRNCAFHYLDPDLSMPSVFWKGVGFIGMKMYPQKSLLYESAYMNLHYTEAFFCWWAAALKSLKQKIFPHRNSWSCDSRNWTWNFLHVTHLLCHWTTSLSLHFESCVELLCSKTQLRKQGLPRGTKSKDKWEFSAKTGLWWRRLGKDIKSKK